MDPANQRSFGPTRTVLVDLVGCAGRQRWLLRHALRSTSELFAAARSRRTPLVLRARGVG